MKYHSFHVQGKQMDGREIQQKFQNRNICSKTEKELGIQDSGVTLHDEAFQQYNSFSKYYVSIALQFCILSLMEIANLECLEGHLCQITINIGMRHLRQLLHWMWLRIYRLDVRKSLKQNPSCFSKKSLMFFATRCPGNLYHLAHFSPIPKPSDGR
jgi:hypothetical protein